jgi:hypothetical protein
VAAGFEQGGGDGTRPSHPEVVERGDRIHGGG